MRSIISGILAVVITVIIAGCKQSGDQPPKAYATCNMLLNLASAGCDRYKNERGSFPSSLDDINAIRDDAPHKDAWGHDFGFTPFDPAKGYGEVTSYGRDGKPGGTGEDSDLVIRFPVKANADWNRQVASSVPLPPQMKGTPNWFDFYLK